MTTAKALLLSLLAVAVATSVAGAEKFVSASAVEPAIGRYLVTLGEMASLEPVERLAPRLAAQYGARVEPYAREGFRGFMIVATPARARLLSLDPRVAAVVEQPLQGMSTPRPPAMATAPEAAPTRLATNAGSGTLDIGTYSYDTAGNISTITGTAGVESFHYDPYGRVRKGAYGPDAWQEYDYDRYGNIKAMRTSTSPVERWFGVDSETNRIDAPDNPVADISGSYDAAGNLTVLQWGADGIVASFEYDALNVVTRATQSGVTWRHLYNASDERIASIDASGFERWTIRDPAGQVLRRFATSGTSLAWTEDYTYRGTAMLASFVPTPQGALHYHVDHLGTPRLITGNGGVKVSEHRYLPFGEEFTDPYQIVEPKKFTGHERDLGNPGSKDDLDYMHARYYATAVARFSSIDPEAASAVPQMPQTWNRYAYAANDPLNRIDADGQRWARLYGTYYDVEPGFPVVLGRGGKAMHIAVVGGFAPNSSGSLDALVWEFGPITREGRMTLNDPKWAKQKGPTLSNSNDESAGGGIWNRYKTQPMAVFTNYKPIAGRFIRTFTEAEVGDNARNAFGGTACSYSNQLSGVIAGGQADCAAGANQILNGLGGTVSGRGLFGGALGILEWEARAKSLWWSLLRKTRPAGPCEPSKDEACK